jgi:DNA gyrase/topoisomerase IV subunit A
MSITKTSMFRTVIHKSFRTFGLDLVRFTAQVQEFPPDFRSDESAIIRAVQPWTMTSAERIYALIQAVRYVSTSGIAGAIVECGVWKGGSMAAVARTLLQLQDVTRELYLFDTFQGMSEPTSQDLDYSGKHAADLLAKNPAFNCGDAPLEAVKKGENSELMAISQWGKMIRIDTKTVRAAGRATQGVRLLNLEPEDKIAAAVIIPPEELKEDEPTLLQ